MAMSRNRANQHRLASFSPLHFYCHTAQAGHRIALNITAAQLNKQKSRRWLLRLV